MQICKKMVCVFIAFMLFSTLVNGCSLKKEDNKAAETILTGTTAEKTLQETTKEEKVTLSVALAVDVPEAYKSFFQKFSEKYPNITIDYIEMPGGNVEEYLQPKAAARVLPDAFSINGTAFGSKLADEGLVADLKDTEAGKKLVDAAKVTFTSKNKGILFGITYGLATNFIYYNKKMFEKAGITSLPDNWEDFLAACGKLKKAGITPIAWTGADSTVGNTAFSAGFVNNVAVNVPDIKNKIDSGELNFDSPEVADIFAKVKLLADKGYFQKGAISTDYLGANDLFVQGKAAMHFDGSWEAGTLTQTSFEVGVFLPPWNPKGKEIAVNIGNETGWGAGELSKHKAEAIKLLEFFTGDGYTIIQNARMSIPAFKETPQGAKLPKQVGDILPIVMAAKVTCPYYYEILPSEVMDLVTKLFQEVTLGKKTPQDAAKTLSDEIVKALSKKQ